MQIDSPARRTASRRGRPCLVALFTLAATAGAAGPEQATELDCGVNALFVLLRLEQRTVTLDRLRSALPARHPDGYSMAELASAARSLGLDLDGVRFAKGDKALTRPAIVFLKEPRGGHFAVLRPVGTTGTMVQVIDPASAPWIADYDHVFSSNPWTGQILVPRDGWIVRNIPILAGIVGLILFVAGSGLAVRTIQQRSSR
jgi:predicted double-glycine peptidase